MPQLDAGCRPNTLAKLDGRTREVRLMRQFRAELTAQLGGKLSFTQVAMVERATWLWLRVAQLDARTVSGEMSDHDARAYLAWSNTLNRCLSQLGIKSPSYAPDGAAQ